ncbi:MAG: DUF5074 domain-containing protein [Bacteroidota bacterium]
MRATQSYLLAYGLCLLLIICGCQIDVSSDDDAPDLPEITSYNDSGIFIANNGNPKDGTSGTISFYERTRQQVVNDIFQKANNNKVLGSNVRQISVVEQQAYILVEDAEKIEIVQTSNFQSRGAVGGFERPQCFLALDNTKAYISQWGADGVNGSIKVLDLINKVVVKEIPTRSGPGQMVRKGNFVYLVNQGGFVLDSVISKIDISTDRIVKTIAVGAAPHSLQVDQNNHLWVLSRGVIDRANPANSRPAKLVRISGDAIRFSLDLEAGASDLVINRTKDQLYFLNDGWIYRLGITETSLPAVPFLARSYTSLAIDPLTNHLVVADPRNLTVAGEVLIFDAQAQEISRFQAGVFPRHFWFE